MKQKVAERIRMVRLANNLSQQNMADELNITVAAYSNIERGVTDISINRLYQIATILKLNPREILDTPHESVFSEIESLKDYGKNDLARQVYLMIKEIQRLNEKTEKLENDILNLKNKN